MKWIKMTDEFDDDGIDLAEEFLIYGHPLFGTNFNSVWFAYWNGVHFVSFYQNAQGKPQEFRVLYYIRLKDIRKPTE